MFESYRHCFIKIEFVYKKILFRHSVIVFPLYWFLNWHSEFFLLPLLNLNSNFPSFRSIWIGITNTYTIGKKLGKWIGSCLVTLSLFWSLTWTLSVLFWKWAPALQNKNQLFLFVRFAWRAALRISSFLNANVLFVLR